LLPCGTPCCRNCCGELRVADAGRIVGTQWGTVMNLCDSLSREVNLHSLTAVRGGQGAPRST
jgi:hypothetical protein